MEKQTTVHATGRDGVGHEGERHAQGDGEDGVVPPDLPTTVDTVNRSAPVNPEN